MESNETIPEQNNVLALVLVITVTIVGWWATESVRTFVRMPFPAEAGGRADASIKVFFGGDYKIYIDREHPFVLAEPDGSIKCVLQVKVLRDGQIVEDEMVDHLQLAGGGGDRREYIISWLDLSKAGRYSIELTNRAGLSDDASAPAFLCVSMSPGTYLSRSSIALVVGVVAIVILYFIYVVGGGPILRPKESE